MKILFFLVAIANVAFFMWEYRTGAFIPVNQISEQHATSDQEQILLVSELKNIPQAITSAPVSEQPVTEIASTDAIDKPALLPEISTVISENSDKPALEKSTALDMNFNELIKIPPVITPEPPVAANDEAVNPASGPDPLPAQPEDIEKPVLEKSTTDDTNVNELENTPQATISAPASALTTGENPAIGQTDKPAQESELSPAVPEGTVKTTSDKSTDEDSSASELTNVPPVTVPAPVSELPSANNTVTDQGDETAPKPAVSTSIDKTALEKSADVDSNVSNTDKNAEACYEVGPFANQQAYQAVVSRLKESKNDIKPINRDDQVPSNFMVYYPAAETEAESKANIKMLKDHGIKDLWLLTGEDKGKISLGLFIKEDSALVMKNELLAKGINAEVKAKYKIKSQKYALIRGDDRLMERLEDLKKTYPELAVKPITDEARGCW